MGTRIIGRVGEAAFSEALRALRASSKRRTLVVVAEKGEAIIQFAADGARALVTGAWAALLEPRDGSGLARLLAEVCRAGGAPFELREGPLPSKVASDGRWVALPDSRAEAIGSLRASAEPPAGDRAPFARLAALSSAAEGAVARHVVLRELGGLWLEAGSPSRASACFREAAESLVEWDEPERALDLLRRAVEVCPFDLNAAEDAIALAVKCGRADEAETLAEKVFSELEKARQYAAIGSLYALFSRRPRSSALRRLGGEGLVRSGAIGRGVEELVAAGRSLESEGDRKGACRIYERALAVDPSADAARKRLDRIRSVEALRGQSLRWGAFALALAVAAGWLVWDAASAAALRKIPAYAEGRPPAEILQAIREQAGCYPLSRQAVRLRRLEADLYARVYPLEREALARAIESHRAWDIDGAEGQLSAIAAGGLIPQFRERAAALLRDLREFRSRAEERLGHASAAVKAGRYEEAFHLYREVLESVRRDAFASGWLVPVLVESVPPGAAIVLGREAVGKTPRWVMLPAATDTLLRIEAPGFQTAYAVDPLRTPLEENTHRLRFALEAPPAWSSCAGGGVAAEAARPGDPLPVLGADGVLRGIDANGARLVWEAPLETGSALTAPRVVGPAVLAAPGRGRLVALAVADGRIAWSKAVAPEGLDVALGPSYAGQVIVMVGRRARLVSPLTGWPVRELELGDGEPQGIAAVAGDVGLFPLRSGGVAGANLRSGKLEFVAWKDFGSVRAIASAGTEAALLSSAGRLAAAGPSGGTFLWEVRLGARWAHLAAASGRVWAGSEEGRIACFESRKGTRLWERDLRDRLLALSADETDPRLVFAQTLRAGKIALVALASRDGEPRWEVELGPEEQISVRALGGLVVVSSPSQGTFAVRIPGV